MRQGLVRLVAVAALACGGRTYGAPFAFIPEPSGNSVVSRIDLAPAGLGSPCVPAATSIKEIADCVLDAQVTSVTRAAAAERAEACQMGVLAGLAAAFPGLCTP